VSVIQPFRLRVDERVLDDLRTRLERVRWPDEPEGGGWDYGTDLGYLQELVTYWRDGFDWRSAEARLNGYPQYRTRIADDEIHFVHVAGERKGRLGLILTHGWPSSFTEMLPLVPLLSEDLDLIIPSLPGFCCSSPITRRGPRRVHDTWAALMSRLGYERFGACGSDVGARVTSALGRFHPERLVGIHLSSVDLEWPDPLPDDLTAEEQDYVRRVERWEREEGGYAAVQSTRPQTLAYGLSDSPVGLAAWLVEKYRSWSDCRGDVSTRFTFDDLLTVITLYWVTGTINSANRSYREHRPDRVGPGLPPGRRVDVPTAVAMFPGESDLLVPQSFAERCYRVERWTDMPRGGHFPAHEEPQLLADDIRSFFLGD
jgi:pimeloyl-ACP methyl ester carboxylesterase